MRLLFAGGALALALAAGVGANAPASATIVLQPDEAASQDVFVYEFGVPGVFGIPTAARVTNLDSATLGAILPPPVPFGNFLGTSNTVPLIGAGGESRAHDTHTLIRFDVSGLGLQPANLTRATINLYAVAGLPPFDDPTPAEPVTIALRAVTGDWTETGVTWETRPSVGADILATAIQDGIEQFVSFDVTDLVRAWLADPASNRGVELTQPDILLNAQGRPIASLFRSAAAVDPSQRPFLAVDVPAPASALLLAGAVGTVGLRRRLRASVGSA